MKILRTPFAGEIRVNRNGDPSAAKPEFHLEVRLFGGIASPRPLDFGTVN
jgi:hypothetical protein